MEGNVRLSGKIAIITGGTRGLGLAMAERFLAEGASVVCAARNSHGIGGLLARHPGQAAYRCTDVTCEQSVRRLAAATVERFGRIDILVANAGISRDGRIARLALADWDATVRTNLTGVFLCTQAVVPQMTAQGGGRIIAVSSSLATRPVEGAAAYCASKAAVEMFTRTAALELGPLGITVNCLSPGYIDEGMGRTLSARPAVWRRYQPQLVLGRLGDAAEIADAAVFLASAGSSYVNGHVLEVNGGLKWTA